jgi:hypothetical protein
MAKSSKTKSSRAKASGKIAAPAIPRPTPDNSRLKSALRIGVVGCAGRMGQMLVRAAAANERCLVVGGVERAGSSAIGRDVGGAGIHQPDGDPASR